MSASYTDAVESIDCESKPAKRRVPLTRESPIFQGLARTEQTKTSAASDELDASAKVRQLKGITDRFDEYLNLPKGWNSYGALTVAEDSVKAAFGFLWKTPLPVLPSAVPTSQGGIQLEWHRAGRDIEITFPPTGEATVYFSDGHSPEKEGALADLRDFVEREIQSLR